MQKAIDSLSDKHIVMIYDLDTHEAFVALP